MPSSSDVIIIPNCDCPEITPPVFDLSSLTVSGLIVELGATLTIAQGSTLTVNNTSGFSHLVLDGNLELLGQLSIVD